MTAASAATCSSPGRIVYLSEIPAEKPPRLFDDEPDVLKPAHVAQLVGVSEKTIRREVARGHLEGTHIGACLRITKAALLRYLGEQQER